MFYTSQPEETRAFLRDKLQLLHADIGEGWLIFDLPEAEIGCHPVSEPGQPPSGTHDVSFYCDDIHGTVASLKQRGVVFDQDVTDAGFGFVTCFTMPGGVKVELYEPKYVKRTRKAKTWASSDRSRTKTRRRRR
jgi:predicted enzyme related to lactoylglutathione lyase